MHISNQNLIQNQELRNLKNII